MSWDWVFNEIKKHLDLSFLVLYNSKFCAENLWETSVVHKLGALAFLWSIVDRRMISRIEVVSSSNCYRSPLIRQNQELRSSYRYHSSSFWYYMYKGVVLFISSHHFIAVVSDEFLHSSSLLQLEVYLCTILQGKHMYMRNTIGIWLNLDFICLLQKRKLSNHG